MLFPSSCVVTDLMPCYRHRALALYFVGISRNYWESPIVAGIARGRWHGLWPLAWCIVAGNGAWILASCVVVGGAQGRWHREWSLDCVLLQLALCVVVDIPRGRWQ